MLDVSGLRWASQQNVVAAGLGRRPGVLQVEAGWLGTDTVIAEVRPGGKVADLQTTSRTVAAQIGPPTDRSPIRSRPAQPMAPAGEHVASESVGGDRLAVRSGGWWPWWVA